MKYYDENSEMLAEQYESICREDVMPSDWNLKDKWFMDFGCGTGLEMRRACNENALCVVGYEPSKSMLSHFIEKLPKPNVARDGISVYTNYKKFYEYCLLNSSSFDYVLSSCAFQHMSWSQQMAAVKLMSMATAKCGRVHISWRLDSYPPGDDRIFNKVDSLWLIEYARKHGLRPILDSISCDLRGIYFKSLTFVKA